MGLFDNIMSAVQGAQGRDGEAGGGMAGLLQAFEGGGAPAGPSSAHVAGLLGGEDGTGDATQGAAGSQGIGGMLETLAANGLGEHVSSWLSSAPNLPISPQQIHDALGSEQVQRLASSSGLPVGDFLRQLSDHLPNAASEVAGTDGG